MSDPIAPMPRLCLIFTLAFAGATAALMALDAALEYLIDYVLPTGAAIGAQMGAAYYAGHRYGATTPGLPDGGWYWLAGLYTSLIAIAVSVVLAVIGFFLLTSAQEREMVYLMWSGESVDEVETSAILGIIAMFVIVMALWVGISTVAHRFIMAYAARKSFDPARVFS